MAPAPETPEDKAKLISDLTERASAYVTKESWINEDYLYKWIQHKAYCVEAAAKGLENCLKWRLANDMNNIMGEDLEDMYRNIVCYVDGHDKEGRIVISIAANLCDIRDALQAGKKERLMRYFLQLTEGFVNEMRKSCAENSGVPSTFMMIIDFDGLMGVSQEVVNFLLSIACLIEDNYPGDIECAYMINASSVVKKIYNFNKRDLKKSTLQRVKVFGSKRHKWGPEILEIVDANQIRPQFGGTLGQTQNPLK